jgi:LysR family transcriptional activator of glutamate synthase operon
VDINYLHEFTTIARLSSFSLAAGELFISQSSLSKHIIALEKELGVQLFKRTSRSVALSEAGTQILPYAIQIFETEKRITNIVAEHNNRQKRVVKIASIPVMAQYGITAVIARFHKQYPEINISVSEFDSQQICSVLESGECELAFNRESHMESRILKCIPFYKDYLVVVLPLSHPLSAEKGLHLPQLANNEFVFINKGSILYDLCFKLCLDSGFTPNIKYTGYWPENIIDFVSQGMGISLLMKRHTDYYNNPGVSCVDVIPTVTSTIYLAKLKSRKLSYAAKVFWDYIKLRK